MTTENIASYYPSLMFAPLVRVLDADPVHATQDLGAANFERRHFIDREYLASVEDSLDDEEDKFLNYLIEPTPSCSKLWGTKNQTDETVVGMLDRRLTVTIYTGQKEGWVQVKLQDVLVVDSLPVPIHISLTALELYPESSVQSLNNFKATSFPEKFRRHPYWSNSDVHTMGSFGHMSVEDSNKLTENILHNATGRPNRIKKGRACANCGLAYCTMTCSRCHRESYCNQQCQRARWKIHKKFCKPE